MNLQRGNRPFSFLVLFAVDEDVDANVRRADDDPSRTPFLIGSVS